MNDSKWHERLYKAIEKLGGEALLEDIYKEIENSGVDLTPAYQTTIRGIILKNSSDSAGYQGKRDWFYSVEGKGKGSWGIREYVDDVGKGNVTEDDVSFPEGKEKLKQHVARERSPKLVREAKKLFIKEHGRLFCEACGFEFEKMYGEIGSDFIEAHHIKPVCEMQEGDKTNVSDIVMVCSNCHRMLHRYRPWKTKEELKTIIKVARA